MAEDDSDDDLFAPGVTAAWGKGVAPQSAARPVLQQPLTQQPAAAPAKARSRSRSGSRPVVSKDIGPGCKVRLHGLKGAAELNGRCGIVDIFVDSSGRWRVKLDTGGSKDLKPENLERLAQAGGSLHAGCMVQLHGLKSAVELNGQVGILESFLSSTSRWRVKLDTGPTKDLKAENLSVLEPEVMEVEGTAASPAPAQASSDVGASKESNQKESDTYLRDNGPGCYIVCDPGARLNDGPSLNDRQITVLPAGTRIEVLQVVMSSESKRLRARIAQPPGWISLLDTKSGHRFAIKDTHQQSTEGERPLYIAGGVDVKVGESCGPGNRFIISSFLGEGGFSTVWLCRDALSHTEYAIKFTRADDVKRRALQREIQLMSHLRSHGSQKDPEGSKHLLCLVGSEGIEHKGHLGVIFEAMKYNLLTALERHGRGRGLPLLPAVRNFGKHLFLALRVLRQASLIHSDIKPENLLVSKDGASIKLADFGNTVTFSEAEGVVDEHMMPRFYRAPEVILGQSWSAPIDIWSAGATLYQMATDRFLFSGDTNNEVVHEMLTICGAFSSDMTSSGNFAQSHFEAGDFLLHESSNMASLQKFPVASFTPPSRPIPALLKILIASVPADVPKERHELLVGHFGDLLSTCLRPQPQSRTSPQAALNHRFFAKGAGDPVADLAAAWAQHEAGSLC